MHGFNLGSTLLVNAEVHFMGGILDDDVGIDTKPSPRRTAIEKAQAELRLEYDVREERRRELEFLEKGGDPLDFKFGHATSVSIQSTSHTHQHPDQNLTSEAKGSFALTASPHGDSVESSGRLGVTTACEPNSADNFDGENETLQSDRKSTHPGRCSVTPSDNSSPLDGCRNVKDSEDSPIFKKGKEYRRRNRSRTNREGPRSSSADLASIGGNVSCVPAVNVVPSKPVVSEIQLEMETDGTHVMHLSTSKVMEFSEGQLNLSNLKEKVEEVQTPSSKEDGPPVAIKIIGCPPSSGAEITEDNATSAQLSKTSMINGNNKCSPTDAIINNVPVMIKGLDSESSCTRMNVTVDENRNIGSDLCTNLENVDSNGSPKEPTLSVREKLATGDDKLAFEEHVTDAMETVSCVMKDKSSISLQENGFTEFHAEVDRGKLSLEDKVEGLSIVEVQEPHKNSEIKSETELPQPDLYVTEMDSSCSVKPLVDSASNELNKNGLSGPSPVLELSSTENQPKPLDKAQEDRILEEARMIEAKRKRIAELSTSLLPREHRRKCHWDLVLEEMAWLANDFAQERLWKMTAAAQMCRSIAFASRRKLEEQIRISKQKSVAHSLAKAVMEFWNSVRISVDNADSSRLEKCKHKTLVGVHDMDKTSEDVLQSTKRKQDHDVYEYAVRFMQFNHSQKTVDDVEGRGVMDVPCDVDLPEISWQNHFTEENLFYAVPPGAIEMYRKSIESCLEECESIGINTREEVDTSGRDALAECDYEEDEGENMFYLPGASNTGKPSKKKIKFMKSGSAGSHELGGDFGYGTPQLNVLGKRPTNNLHVDPIPTKRMRTAPRHRVVGPFGAGPTGFAPVLSTAGTSSGDTNSFEDDQSTPRGGSVVPRGSEVDSAMNFEKHSTFDSAEMSAKPKKKKKIKHPRVSYDHRWQLDSSMHSEQKDLVRKRLDNHQLESNGNGSFGQLPKKPKSPKLSLDNSFDNTAPMSGSIASPVASQMSNMPSQTTIIKFIGGRDRAKKGKGLKVSTGQLGSGSPWTIVEDQALVVLVHDMGPNWELVSDAINNILQFKCIFRKPPECKERHKFLMDRPSGDGADSAEDSGSSQPYPSTLPGIPKGSARQLFRSLHAHVEEDNIKSRFEKIIFIEQQLQFRKKKNDNEDLKKIAPVHGSHVLSLSQVIPNNVNGGVLTPLDLCDTATSNPGSLSIEYNPLSNQSNISPMQTPGGPSPSLQGQLNMGIGNNLASPSSQFTSPRDGRYSIPRPGSLPIEEQQRLHQYSSMLPGRKVQVSAMSSSGSLSGPDRGVRTHPGMNRSIPMTRPGAPGITSSMVSSGNVLASNLGGMPSNMNVNSGTASGNGNTTFRSPRDSLHVIRPGQNSEHQRQIVLPEMQIQTTQTNTSGVPSFGGLSSSPLPTFPGHHPSATSEQQAYLRLARERQMHQRLLQQQHHQHPASSSLMMQGAPQPHQQQKNLQGHGRNPQSGSINQVGKQRIQQSGRQHPQQSQQAKLVKGIARGNMSIHQNLPVDTSHLNGITANTVSPVSENIYTGSSLNTVPLSKPLASPASPGRIQPQKPYSKTAPGPTSKPVQRVSSHLEGGNLGPDQGVPSSSVVHSRNHHQPVLQRASQQNQVNSDSLTKSQGNHPKTKQQALSVPPSECANSASNVVRKVPGPTSNQSVANPLSSEPFSPSNNLVSHGHESQWQQQESQLQAAPLQPILSQKQSRQQLQQLEQPPQKVLQLQSQPQIQGGQNAVISKTTNSRLD